MTISKTITKSQRRALNRIIRFYRRENNDGVTSVRISFPDANEDIAKYGFFFVCVKTRRSDCDKYSPRAILCEQSAMFKVGKRGGLKVMTAYDGLRETKDFVRSMLRCS